MPAILGFFQQGPQFAAIGVASFGPLVIDGDDPAYGTILDSPKLDWQGFSWPAALEPLMVPVHVHTDVVAAALAEAAATNVTDLLAYITAGTGIGLGLVRAGKCLPGNRHAEFGHIYVRQHPDDAYVGCCPYHGNCLEGLASGAALIDRWDVPAD